MAGPLSPSSPAKDPALMTDAEIIAELMDNLNAREKSIIEREKSIETREARLTARESDLTTREANLTERNNLLTLRKEILDETATYWKNYKSDTLQDKLAIGGVSFVLGFVSGAVTVAVVR